MSKIAIREKILVMGPPGTGKSYAGLMIARCFPESHFFALDTDDAIPRMLATEFTDLKNITVYSCVDWPQYVNALVAIEKKSKPGDWLMIDLISQAWNAIQNYYVETVFNESVGDYFLRVRMEAGDNVKRLETLSGWVDWVPIKANYNDWLRRLKYKVSAHIYATASVRAARDADEREIKEMFAGGKLPEGEKHLGHEFHTILSAEHLRDGWVMSTVKDRGRKPMNRQPMPNFGLGYAIAVAGLKPKVKTKKEEDKK